VTVNWKRWGRKLSWPNTRFYPTIFLEELIETTENLPGYPVSRPKFEPVTSWTQSRNVKHWIVSLVIMLFLHSARCWEICYCTKCQDQILSSARAAPPSQVDTIFRFV
jgi:hypothetical protein